MSIRHALAFLAIVCLFAFFLGIYHGLSRLNAPREELKPKCEAAGGRIVQGENRYDMVCVKPLDLRTLT